MKFHEIKSESLNLITDYSDSSVSIGNKIINHSSIIFPDSMIENIDLQKVSDFNSRNIKNFKIKFIKIRLSIDIWDY